MSISFDPWFLWWLTFNSFHSKVKSAPVPLQSTLRDINTTSRTSLVVEWIGICLPLQGTQVWSLIWKDFTCHGQLKPTCHSDWACTLKPVSSTNKRSHRNEEPAHCNEEQPCSLQLEKACTQQPDPAQPKNKQTNKLFKKKNPQANLF